MAVGQECRIVNHAGGAISVVARGGQTIDGGANYALGINKQQNFQQFTSTQVFSMQLG
jgi:hypothetical protein